MFVRDFMQREVTTVSPGDTLAMAIRLTRAHRVHHLPVVTDTLQVEGILSDRDIRLAMPSSLIAADAEPAEIIGQTPIGGIMSRDVITVGPDETVEGAAKLLYRHRIGALPVVDGQNHLVGMITETDILHAFVRVLGVAEPSSRIEIALEDRPGELGRALTLISECGLNVVSAVVPSFSAGESKRAILHLATIDPREAIAALEEANFSVGWPAFGRDIRSLEAAIPA